MENNKVFAVILAGGRGERFWPQSRASHPKQLLRLMGNLTMIEQATDRLIPLVPVENILVITNQEYVNSMQQLLRRIPSGNIIGELTGLDTAPCMALAAGIIRARAGADGDPVMVVSPADHIIRNSGRFREIMADAVAYAAKNEVLVTLGVKPRFLSTGFGYVKHGILLEQTEHTRIFQVESFTEKPNSAIAEACIASGRCWWNSGFFVWRHSVIMNAMQEVAPGLHKLAAEAELAELEHDLLPVLRSGYAALSRNSIDYAIMEKTGNIVVAEVDFDWEDVGSWTSMRSQTRAGANNNVVRGLFASLDTYDCCVVSTPGHLVATIDVRDLIIVHTDDATLVCSEKSAQRVKELVQKLNKNPEMQKFL